MNNSKSLTALGSMAQANRTFFSLVIQRTAKNTCN